MTDPLHDPGIQAALEGLEPDLDALAAGSALRRVLPPELALEAARLHALRRRARGKLDGASRLLLTEKGLEQASHRHVAGARAARFARHVGGGVVLDATAGIGGDSMALAAAGVPLVAADRDPRIAGLLRANLAGRTGGARILVADAERPPLRPDLLLLDPDRRRSLAGDRPRRLGDPARWSPPWRTCLALVGDVRGACVKLAPGTDVDRLDPRSPELPHAWQWVSLRGELKELDLWIGALAEAGGIAGHRQVLALDGRGGAASLEGIPAEVEPLDPEAAAEVSWIAEPDPALIRSGLLGSLAREEALAPLGPGIAYLGGDHMPRSPLLQAYEVIGSAPLDRRRVRAMLAEHGIGPVTVKKRGHPDTAKQLAGRLRGSGKRRGILLVSRLARGHRAWLVRREDSRSR